MRPSLLVLAIAIAIGNSTAAAADLAADAAARFERAARTGPSRVVDPAAGALASPGFRRAPSPPHAYTFSGTALRPGATSFFQLLYPGACQRIYDGTYSPRVSLNKNTNPDQCTDSSICSKNYACAGTPGVEPKFWHVVDAATVPASARPAPLTGTHFLWCGMYDPLTGKVGYVDQTFQILFVDAGSVSGPTTYNLTFQMNWSAYPGQKGLTQPYPDWVYLIGATGSFDPLGNDATHMQSIIDLGGASDGTGRLLVKWRGSINGGISGATSIDATQPAAAIFQNLRSEAPATLSTSIKIDSQYRYLYFIFHSITPYSTFDTTNPWNYGNGLAIDQIASSVNGAIYTEESPPVDGMGMPIIDGHCGTVLKGDGLSPVISARVPDTGICPPNAYGCPVVAAEMALALPPDACNPLTAGADSAVIFADPGTTFLPADLTSSFQSCPLPVPVSLSRLYATWDYYLDLPYGNGYVQVSEYRFFKDGAWSDWRNTSPSAAERVGGYKAWLTQTDELPEAVAADSVQLRYTLKCDPSASLVGLECLPTGGYGLIYDNFGLVAETGLPAPVFGLFPGALAQTTFVDGTMTGFNCATPPCWPGIRGSDAVAPLDQPALPIHDNWNSPLGDSITIAILSPLRRQGMGLNWHHGFDASVNNGLTIARTNASYNPAYDSPRMIYRLFDPSTKTWSPFDSTEMDADNVFVGPTDTTLVGNAFRVDWPPRDRVGLNLPGGFTINGIAAYSNLAFLPRGSRMQYYVKAVDVAGGRAYQFQSDGAAVEVSDLPTLPGGSVIAPDIMTWQVLPGVYPAGSVGTLLAGKTNTPLLNLDGSYGAWSFSQDPVTQALRALGVRSDRYRLQQGIYLGAGIGGHELTGAPDNQTPRSVVSHFPNMTEYAIKDSLAAWYRVMIESSHTRISTLQDESDARLLEEWWNTSTGSNGGDRCLFVSGDDYANQLVNAPAWDPSPRRHSFASNVLGVNSASNAWNGTSSVPYPTVEDRFANPSSGPALAAGYTYPVDGGCPSANRFDALTKGGTPEAQNASFYPIFSGVNDVAAVARMSEKDAVADKDRNKALSYGYSIQFIRKAGIPTSASDYVHSGVQERMQVLYKFLASCRGARTGAIADSGKCWPCPTDANLTGNWAVLTGFQTGVYGPLYPIQDNTTVTSVFPGGADVPAALNSLRQNRPNPFNPSTTIPFATAVAGRTLIRVYDVAGRLVRTIDAGLAAPGEHLARWDGRDQSGESVGTGVYFYRIEFPGGGTSSRKMILLR